MSLQSELRTLFGDKTLEAAAKLAPEQTDALAVQVAAGALLRLKGKPERQASYVRSLNPSTAAALCRWLADPSFWGLVAGVTRH